MLNKLGLCYCRAKLARLQHDTSTTWFQKSNLIHTMTVKWNGCCQKQNTHTQKKGLANFLIYSNVFHNLWIGFGTAVARRLKPSQGFQPLDWNHAPHDWHNSATQPWAPTGKEQASVTLKTSVEKNQQSLGEGGRGRKWLTEPSTNKKWTRQWITWSM